MRRHDRAPPNSGVEVPMLSNKRNRYETGLCLTAEWIALAIMFVAFTMFAIIAGAGLFVFVVAPLVMLFSGSTDGVSLAMHVVGLVVCIASTVLPTWIWGLDRNRLWTGVELDSAEVIFIASVFSARVPHKNITVCEFAYAQLREDSPKSAIVERVAADFLVQCRIFTSRRSRPLAIFLRHTDAEELRSILEKECVHTTFRTQRLPSWLEEKSPDAKSGGIPVVEMPTTPPSPLKEERENLSLVAHSDEDCATEKVNVPWVRHRVVEDLHLVKISTATLALAGGGFGLVDAGLVGLTVGTLLGAGMGLPTGELVRVFLGCFIGFKDDQDEELKPEKERLGKWARRIANWGAALLALIFQVVFFHEMYWSTNVASLAETCDIAHHIRRSTNRGDTRVFLRETVNANLWKLRAYSARPLRWCLRDEIYAMNRVTQEVCDVINGKAPVGSASKNLGDTLHNEALRRLWQSDDWKSQVITDRSLNVIGSTISRTSMGQVDGCLQRTWLVKYMPREWIIVDVD